MWYFFKSWCCGCCDDCCELEQPINTFDNFSYRGITEAPLLQRNYTYMVRNQGQQGISLGNRIKITENSCLRVGWKFHIAVDFRDIEKAWDAIKDIVMEENIMETKMIPKHYLKRMSQEELGREITIYAYREDDSMDWWPLITKIEAALDAAGVRQGRLCPATLAIPGCKYFSYRCEQRPVPVQYNYMTPREFYTSRSISINCMYIDIVMAQIIAQENGTHPANPYDFPVPEFIMRLLNRVEPEIL